MERSIEHTTAPCDHDRHHDHHHDLALPGANVPVERAPAHWLMARLGKRVLRPGGRELTRWLIDRAGVEGGDAIVELAPGLGSTARELLARGPRRYVGVERDRVAAAFARAKIAEHEHADARVVEGDAARAPLPDRSATLVVGEAMLSMQPGTRKRAIVREAARLLDRGGRYAIHELAVAPDRVPEATLREIERDLSSAIRVGVRIGTAADWRGWLEAEGFAVDAVELAPMRLLEVDRLIQDEGWIGAVRFAWNAAREPAAMRRLLEVRARFRAHAELLRGIAIVARRR